MKKLIYLLLAGTLAFASCSKDDPAPIAVGGITLDKTQLTLKLRQSETLTATVTPEDAADKTVTWESSDPKVATVDNSGKVTAMVVGSATITARAGEKSATCAVTVDWPVETVLIKAGKFLMGSPKDEKNGDAAERPQHWVKLTKDFYMGKYEVTNAQYADFLNVNGIGEDGKWAGGSDPNQILIKASSGDKDFGLHWENAQWVPTSGYEQHPVINVSWYGAKAYCDWLTRTTGGVCTLPTEAQWEYACRAGTTTAYSYGNEPNGDYMWYDGNNTPYGPKAVGTKKPNPWGLYDMHGNVWEWCLDKGDSTANYPIADTEEDAIVDPLVTEGKLRRTRGGGYTFNNGIHECRSAYRKSVDSGIASYYYGFRVIFPVE